MATSSPSANRPADGPGVLVVTNAGAATVDLPAGEVLVSSGPLGQDGGLPADTTVWLRPTSA